MHPLKVPGPDGIPALFYQRYWHIAGREVKNLLLDIPNNGKSLEALNKFFNFQIPMGKNPHSKKYFCPISLCNVTLKLVTKCITNKLKPLLPNIVNMDQSAFVQGLIIVTPKSTPHV